MNKRVYVISGISFILFGLVIGFNSMQNITGYVVFEGADMNFGSILALSLILGGMVVLAIGERQEEYSDRESRLREIMGDRRYESLSERDRVLYDKALRRNDLKKVKNASIKEEVERKPLTIRISSNALKRARRDSFVFNARNRYIDEIEKIAEDPAERVQEKIGEFQVSPQGDNQIRVAWHRDSEGNVLYIDDFLYHKTDRDYVDNWNHRAERGEINRRTYARKGYKSFSGKL